MGIADLPDISDEDWNAYTADQFRAATDPILDSLRFQHDTATGFDPIFSQVMAQQQADDERRRREEELARQQQMQQAAQQQARMAQMQQASQAAAAPYDDLRAMMSAPDQFAAPQMGAVGPVQGPPGPNEVLPGVPKGGGDQPGFWSGTSPGAPNVFSYIGQEAQRGADELRRSGATQVPVIGGLMGGTAQGVANFANTLGGAAEGLRGGDPFAAVGGPLQATLGETGPLEGMWRSVAEEYQTPEQVLPFIDPDTPVIGGLNNPREWGGIAGNVLMPETAAEQAFGKGLSAVGKPVVRAAGQAAQPLVEALGRAADQFGVPQAIDRGMGAAQGIMRHLTQADDETMFHGTPLVFDQIDETKFNNNGLFGPGYYLTREPEVASSYASETRVLNRGNHIKEPDLARMLNETWRMVSGMRNSQDPMEQAFAKQVSAAFPTTEGRAPMAIAPRQAGGPAYLIYPQNAQGQVTSRVINNVGDYANWLDNELVKLRGNQFGGNLPPPRERAQFARLRANVSSHASDLMDRYGSVAAPNVRKITVPAGTRLLDLNKPIPDDEMQMIQAAASQIPSPAFSGRTLWDDLPIHGEIGAEGRANGTLTRAEDLEAVREGITGPIGFDYWRGLMNITGAKKEKVNELLSAMGYDGIRHKGGLRSPVMRNGVPIGHDVDIIFPDKVGKVRNAISGVPKGITAGEREETHGRFLHGGGFVFDTYDPEKFDPDALFGPGLYGTKDPRLASSYASSAGRGATPVEAADAMPEIRQVLDSQDTGFTIGRREDHLRGNALLRAVFPEGLPEPMDGQSASDYLDEIYSYIESKIQDPDHPASSMTGDWMAPDPLNGDEDGATNIINRMRHVGTTAPGPANIRPFEVAPDLRLLDADSALPSDEWTQIENHLEGLQRRDVNAALAQPTMDNSPGVLPPGTRNWDDAINKIYREQMARQQNTRGYDETAQATADIQGFTGNDVYRGLEQFFNGDRKAVNQLLSDIGYDGLTHKGGMRSPLPDEAGNPIVHQVAVIFPDRLESVFNSLTGRRGGIIGDYGDEAAGGVTREAGGPVTPNGQWPSQWGPQPKPQIRLPNIHPAWQNYQFNALARRARSQMIGGAAVGGVTGAAAGGAGAYAATDENDNPALRALATGSGAISGGVAGLALGAIGSPVALGAINRGLIDLIDKRVLEGKIPVNYLQTHPMGANRIRAIMRAMAQDAQPGEVVRVPGIIGALDKVSPLGIPDEVRNLVTGDLTKEEVLSLLGPGDPTAESKDLKSMVIDFIRALPMGTERAEEHAADIFAAQGRMGLDVDPARAQANAVYGNATTSQGNKVRDIANQIAEHLGLDTSGPNRLFGTQPLGGHINDSPNIGFQMRTRREAQTGGKPILVWNTAFENLPLTKDEFADVMAHEFYHFLEEIKRNDRGLWSALTDQAGGVGRFAGMAGEAGGELADDLTPDEDVLPPPESASDYLSRVVNELTPAGRAAAQRYGEEVAHRAPWAGNVIEQTERLPEGNRWEQVLRVAQPEGAADDSSAIGDAMDAANAANPLPYTPPVKRPAGPRDDRNLGGANVLANQPEGMQEMAAQGIAELQQELRASHGFRTEKESREAAERVMEFILPFAREAQPNEPVNEALLRAGREAWAQSHWPSYYAMIDHAKMAADPDADPDLLAAAEQAMNYWQGIRQVLGRYAGEIAPSESGRTFRSMRDVPGPVVPGVAGGSGEVVNRAAKTGREKAYERMQAEFRKARRGEQAGQDVSTTATQRAVQRVGGKRPNGPLAAMGLEWEDILRRTGDEDADRTNLLAGLEELGGYRFRRDRTKAAMNLDLNDGAAVGKFWDEARTAAGVDKEMRPFVKFDPNVSGQSYLGGADTITKQQALQMVSKELIKDADEATAALRAARNQGKSPTALRDLEATAKRAYERMGLRIESWPPDSFPVLRRAAESVRNRIEREWPADRKAGSGAEEAVEKKRQLLGIFDQELKKEQKLAGVPVTGLQDLMSFGTSNVLTTARFVQASVLESALSSINEPFQAFLRGDYAGAGRQLQGLGRAFGLITSGDIAALGEGIKAPAIVNALRGIKDIGPMQAAGEMRDVAERGAGHIRSDSANRLAKLMSPMHKVSRGISEAFQTGNYFGEVNRLVHTAAESGILPGGRRIEQIVDETGVKRNPNVREMMGNLPQEIVDAALKQSRFVNEGGHAGWLERQLGDAKGLLNKPGATGGERATGLFANLMFPFVYGLRPMIKSGTRTLFSAPIHGAEFAKAIRAGDGEGAKYAAKKFALANSFNGFIAYHVISGNITGHGPQDPGTRQALMEATDEHGDPIWRPDSIRLPNPGGDEAGHTWVKYTSMPGPVSIVATVMGNMYEAYAFDGKDMESTAETLSRVMPEIAKGVMDNTYFRDMINLVEALNATGGAPGISRVAGQVAGRFVPAAGALRTAATLMDPQQRLATNPVEDIQSGIPGLRERLPAQVSPYSGRPSEQPLSPVTALGGISGNVYASPSERNPIARETVAASRRSLPWEGGVRPSEGLESDVFPRTFTRGEQSRGLDFAGARQTGEGIRGAQVAFGRESGEEMLRLIESPQYQAADPRLKAQMLTQAANRSGQRGEYAAFGAPGVNPSPEKRLERARLQTARFRGVRGAPDEIAEQNQKIAQARETLSELSARIGRSRAINLMRKTDPEAYRLATRYRPMSQDRLWMQEQANKASLGIPDDDGQFLIPDFGTGGNMLDLTGLPNMQNRRPSQRR